ncbi:MAG: transglutaminase domain-containing protein [Verrucomicrobiales bacterium]|nr:transglutaminase domain-containing protein [Verrucomicrobiales bacterium]
MISRLSLVRLCLTAVLLGDAVASRAVTGSGLHQALLLAGMLLYAIAWWAGPTVAGLSSLVLSSGIGLGAWWLFERDWVPVTLSEWPAVFHFAVGSHFWLWSQAIGARRHPIAAVENTLFSPLTSGLAFLAAAAAIWSTGTVEIYGTSTTGIRLLASLSLILPALLAWGAADGVLPGAGGVTISRRKRRHRFRNFLILSATVTAGLWLATLSQRGTDRLADTLYGWISRWNQPVDSIDITGLRPLLETGGSANDTAMRDLPRRAEIRMDDTVRFRLQFDDPLEFAEATRRPLYLRASAMPMLAGDGRLGPRRQGRWIYDSDDRTEDGITRIETDTVSPAFRYWVLIDRTESAAIPLVNGTRSLGLPGIYHFADGWYQLSLEDHQAHVRFQAAAAPLVWRPDGDDAVWRLASAPPDYLQLPATPLARRIAALARETVSPAAPLSERLGAIRSLLAGRCEYSLEYRNPDDLEPIENFLFAERRGHCELFSTSSVMLLRALGVPARVAFGYTGGESDPTRGLVAFRQSDYHSWAEILIAGHGWAVFDTTPAGSGALRPPRPNPRAAALATFDPAEYEDIGAGVVIAVSATPWLSRAVTAAIEWVSTWFPYLAALFGLAMAGAWWRRQRGKSRGSSPFAAESPAPALPVGDRRIEGLLQTYLGAWAERGCPKPPGHTLLEFLADLKRRGLCNDEFDDLVHYLYRVRYAGGAADLERESQFRTQLAAFATPKSATI